MLKVLVTLLLAFYSIMNAQAYKEANYQLLTKDGNIETRLYKKAYLAKYNSVGNRESASNKSFMPLFNYIKEGGIPMTIPVTQEEVRPNEWDLSFFMPSEKSLEYLPKPKDSKVKIIELQERKVIVYKFTGSMNDENFKKYNLKLVDYMKKNNIKAKGKVILATYNSPFTPWFMKRSEIMYEVL